MSSDDDSSDFQLTESDPRLYVRWLDSTDFTLSVVADD